MSESVISCEGYHDRAWLTREFSSRHLNTAVPEDSLLLRKVLGRVPHEGGKLIREDSHEHRLLLDWIVAG